MRFAQHGQACYVRASMWAVDNRTTYGVGRTWGRNKDGVHEWIVAVRASFDIGPKGRLEIADDQPEPFLAAEYNGEDGASSLRYEADLVGPKPTTDIVLNGTAHAPAGRASRDFMVSMRVGKTEKVLRVLGERYWMPTGTGLQASGADAVVEVPIVYERAYGGFDARDPDPKRQKMDARNPVGVGVVAAGGHWEGEPLHNFEYPKRDPITSGPAGFGAIASHWMPRLSLQGTYDDAWARKRRPLLPEDWEPRALQCAPQDQQATQHLRGGEPVELLNLTPNGAMRFDLPKAYFTFETKFSTLRGHRSEEHRAKLSTVILEPDHPRVVMVWTSCLLVRENEDYLDETIVREKPYL